MKTAELQTIKEGTILYTSWGYDCTIHDYCRVLKVGKTLLCQMIGTQTIKEFMGGKEVKPNPEAEGQTFRIKISRSKNYPDDCWLVGSYPFCWDRSDKRKGSWYIYKEESTHIDTER